MKVAVTGGTGIIGKNLVEVLSRNYEVIVLSRGSLNNSSENWGMDYPLEQTDYTIDSLKNIFCDVGAVVHLAALRLQKSVPENSFENVQLDYNVFRASDISNITNIVFTSTRGVYGNNPNIPWTEDSQPSPQNPYSLGKLLSEKSAVYFNQKGLSIKCLRLAQVLSADARKKYMLGTFIENALQGKELQLYANENQKREYIYVKDVVNGIIAALKKPNIQGIFNLGSGEQISIPELAKLIVEKSGGESKIQQHMPESDRQENSIMDSGLFYSTFDFKISWTIEEALTDMFNQLNS